MTEQEELQYLLANSPKALPDDPSSSGWSTSQIKEKHYKGLVILYNWIKAIRTAYIQTENIIDALNDNSTDKPLSANMGKTLKELIDSNKDSLDADISRIDTLLASNDTSLDTIQKIVNFIKNNKSLIDTLSSGKINVSAIVDDLLSTDSTKVLSAKQGKILKDLLDAEIGNRQTAVSNEILARQNADELLQNNINAEIGKLTNGTTIVDKAYKDHNGNNIDSTYVKIANIINALNDTSTNKPLSAAQGKALKDMIDAINTLLASDTTTLDTLQEVVNYIKNNKSLIDGITISKMAFTDLVKNLTTNNDNLPLAASQGYALKAMIDAINDAEDGIQAAEALRVIAEAGRVEAEEARQTGYSGFDSRITANTNAISGIKDGTNIDSFSDVESALATKTNTSDVYAKSEVYTKTETQALHTDTLNSSKSYTDQVAKDLQWQLGTYDLSVETVNGTTMLLPSPSGTIQATMVRIDGASEVSENLVNIPNGTITSASVSFVFANGVCNSSGTPSMTGWIRIKAITLQAGTYYYKDFTTGSNPMRIIDSNYNAKITQPFTLTNQETMYLAVTGNSINDYGQLINSKPMLVSGSNEPTTWKQGYTGIHNLELSGLKVEGANLANPSLFELGSISTTSGSIGQDVLNNSRMRSNYIEVKPNTEYTLNYDNYNVNYFQYDEEYRCISNAVGGTFTTTATTKYVRFYGGVIDENTKVLFNEGTNTTYIPYVSTTKTIDLTSIEDSGGNKLFADGSIKGNENVQDIIEPTYQESAWDKVDLGSLTFTYTSSQEFQAPISNMKNIADNVLGNLICSIYKTIKWNELGSNDMAIASAVGYIRIKNSNYTTVEAFKTAMNGVILNFERNKYLTSNTNLSQLVKFEAHSNGSITLVNTNNQDTTSTFKYLKEVAK